MCKSDVFQTILRAVSAETEIPTDAITNPRNKLTEVVDARHIVIYYLKQSGLYPSEISRLMGMSRRAVNYSIMSFSDRLEHGGKMVRINWENIKKLLGNK